MISEASLAATPKSECAQRGAIGETMKREIAKGGSQPDAERIGERRAAPGWIQRCIDLVFDRENYLLSNKFGEISDPLCAD